MASPPWAFQTESMVTAQTDESPSRKWPISLSGPWQGWAECTFSPPMKSSFCIYEMRTDGALHSTNGTELGSKDGRSRDAALNKISCKPNSYNIRGKGMTKQFVSNGKKKNEDSTCRRRNELERPWGTDSLGTAELTGHGAISTGMTMCKTYPVRNKTTFKKPSWKLPSSSGVREGKHIQVTHSSTDSQTLQLSDRLTVLQRFYI